METINLRWSRQKAMEYCMLRSWYEEHARMRGCVFYTLPTLFSAEHDASQTFRNRTKH